MNSWLFVMEYAPMYIGYYIFAYIMKLALSPVKDVFFIPRENFIFFILSPDYTLSRYFKETLKKEHNNKYRMKRKLKSFVQKNNEMNFVISITLTIICFILYHFCSTHPFYKIICTIAIIRFISRSIEIIIAFCSDIVHGGGNNTTGLNKYERIRLAFTSYFEIIIYSAAAYTLVPTVTSVSKAIVLSLSVGTLTNVGYAFSGDESTLNILLTVIVFLQVIASQSLVILSLAGYLSRNK